MGIMRDMSTILDKIVADKRREVVQAKARLREAELRKQAASIPSARDFYAALAKPGSHPPDRRSQAGQPLEGPAAAPISTPPRSPAFTRRMGPRPSAS